MLLILNTMMLEVNWCGNDVVQINEDQVTLHWARLVPRWVLVSGFNSQFGTFISVCNQPPRSTQPGHPFVGRRNEYQPKGGDALRLESKGTYGSCVGGRWNCVITSHHCSSVVTAQRSAADSKANPRWFSSQLVEDVSKLTTYHRFRSPTPTFNHHPRSKLSASH